MKKAFTLFEIIIVIAVFAVLSGYALMNMQKIPEVTDGIAIKSSMKSLVYFEEECGIDLLKYYGDGKIRYCNNQLGSITTDEYPNNGVLTFREANSNKLYKIENLHKTFWKIDFYGVTCLDSKLGYEIKVKDKKGAILHSFNSCVNQ